jgi:hypothetical protein
VERAFRGSRSDGHSTEQGWNKVGPCQTSLPTSFLLLDMEEDTSASIAA